MQVARETLGDNAERSELIRLAIEYAAGKNENVPSQVRRILKQKFSIDVLELEVEAVCQRMAGDAVLKLARISKA